jgi:IclR family mhp operon transcriptional activator
MSFETAGYDLKFQIHESALGLAYLAFCTADERRSILAASEASRIDERAAALQRPALERYLATVRERGVAFTRSTRSRRVNGMAAPIQHGQHVIGALTLRYPKRAMTEDQVVTRYGARLVATAREIATRVFTERTGDPAALAWPEKKRPASESSGMSCSRQKR